MRVLAVAHLIAVALLVIGIGFDHEVVGWIGIGLDLVVGATLVPLIRRELS